MQKVFTRPIANLEASRKLAQTLCDDYLIPSGNFVLFLEGGLGAGKTFLVREMLNILGVSEEVTSPTYALVNQYTSDHPTNGSSDQLAHFDFYRLEEPNDFFARGFSDIADDKKVSCFVEWPEKISPEAESSFSGAQFTLKIEFGIGVGMRKVTLLAR